MPKSYEDEIRDLLKGMDRFPGESRAAPRRPRRPSFGRLPSLGHLDPRQIMGGALILMLFAWILRIGNYPWLELMAGYISLASLVLFVVALILLIRGGGFGSPSARQMWRGRVIEMPRRGSLFGAWRQWFRRRSSPFSRGRTGSRGRDSFQW